MEETDIDIEGEASHEYEIMPKRNPCYDDIVPNSNSQDTTTPLGVGVAAKKPARGCPCSWVCIGLVLVGVVACVSMAVAVWSIAKVHNISNSCEAWKEDAETAQVMGLVHSDRIDDLNATLVDVVHSFSSELSSFRQDANTFHNSVTQAITGLLPSVPATSCLQVSLYPSGYYWVRASNGSAVRMYCDVTRSCGGATGGWMRVAHLDFNNTSTLCPSGLQERVDSGIRTCGIESSEAACPSVMFSTSGVEYTKVCGKVIAYQDSTTDAFGDFGRGPNPNIDSNYVDGVSLTHGHTPRNHIWTFAAAVDEGDSTSHLLRSSDSTCECSYSQGFGKSSPSFIGQDYFCDSGLQNYHQDNLGDFFPDDPLWDGRGCGSESTCCSFNSPPWFHKELPSPTSDDIEMRVCCDEDRSNEDIAMSSVEIYVQ